MTDRVPMGFEPESVTIAISDILPVRQVSAAIRKSRKYRQIDAAVREVGIVHPPVVARHHKMKGTYLLLDGHLRIEVLKELGVEVLKELGVDKVTCLVSLDDEAFTYNRQVNRLAPIQEHRMIMKLIERGIPEERIAQALDVNVVSIRARRNLLHGICPEAAELFKDKHCPINTIQALKKMKPLRQVDVAEMMIMVNNYSVSYAKALVASTSPDELVDGAKPKMPKAVSPEQIERVEQELVKLRRGIKREQPKVEATFGPDHLILVLAIRYVESLLGNAAIDRYLEKHHPELRAEFIRICEAAALVSEAAE